MGAGGASPCSGGGIHTSETSGNVGPCLSGKARWCDPQLECRKSTSKPRWADICEEEDEKERIARAAVAADAGGKSENAVDYVEAKAADTKAGEAHELRGVYPVFQSCTEICTGYNEQSAKFRVDSRSFRAACRRGSSRFSGSPRALTCWHYALLK